MAGDAKKRNVWVGVLVAALVVSVAFLIALATIWFSYFQGQQKYAALEEHADVDAGELRGLSVDWDALRAANPDVVAWIYIPGTNVNYPIVQGEDNEYYLSHDFGGEAGWLAQYGAVFMDWRNDPNFNDDSYFFYGHHMNDGSMFSAIAQMTDQARFDEERTVFLLSPSKNFQLRTFSLVRCAADDSIVQVRFASPEEKAAYMQDKIDRSIVNAGEIPRADGIAKSFAFATCDNVSDGRYVLFAYVEDETEG